MKQARTIMTMAGAALLCMTVTGSALALKIGIVDQAEVVQKYDKTKASQERLEKEFADKSEELKKMNEKLAKQQEELQSKKGIVAQKQYNSMQSKFEDDQDAFREKYKDVQASFIKKKRDLMESILNDVKAAAAQIAKSEKYDLIIDKEVALYGGDDLTYRVLDQLNRKK